MNPSIETIYQAAVDLLNIGSFPGKHSTAVSQVREHFQLAIQEIQKQNLLKEAKANEQEKSNPASRRKATQKPGKPTAPSTKG